jgi:chromosome segregation ATPase
MSGWKLTAAILGKHAAVLGDKLAAGLAAWDPETATQVDRDKKAQELREVAVKLADAKQKNDAAQAAANSLEATIANDTRAAEVLIAKFNDKKIDEATLNEFASNLEANKAKLPGLQQDAADAQQLVDTLKEILDTVQKNIDDFDAKVRAATHTLEQAKADQHREELRQQNQHELNELRSGTGGASTGLAALERAAGQARVQADAAKTISDIGQKPLDRAAAVEEARRIAAGGADTAAESPADRLRRIASGG